MRLKKHGYQEAHIHPEGWVSGVLYLKTIEETFKIRVQLNLACMDMIIIDVALTFQQRRTSQN